MKLNDIAQELFILNQTTVNRLFSSDNPADNFALYCFYYKTAKGQKTNSVYANDGYTEKCLKWGKKRLRKAKDELKQLGMIEQTQRRNKGKIEGWYIEIKNIGAEK